MRTSAERIVSQNRLKMNAFGRVLIVSLAVVLCFGSIAGEPVRINKDAVFVAYAFSQRLKNSAFWNSHDMPFDRHVACDFGCDALELDFVGHSETVRKSALP
jgi:hypothetical protein